MISVRQEVEKILQESPFVEDLMTEGLINLSSYARKIQPTLEERLGKPVSVGSIVMSLKRLGPKLSKRGKIEVGDYIEDIIVRSGLVASTYENLDSLTAGLKTIVDKFAARKDLFVNFSRGNFETTLTCNQSILPEITKILKSETLVSKFDNIGAITIKLVAQTTETNGVYYSIFKMVANRGVNIIEVISTFKELTILVSEDELDKAFTALKGTLK
jgi:hypothetical protein